MAREQRQKDCIICEFQIVTVWVDRSADFCVKHDKQRREDAALWRASGSEEDVGQVIHQHSLRPIGEEVYNPTSELVVIMEA